MNKSHNLTMPLVKMFVVLAETRTTAQTGRELHLSQSAISHNLRKLREELSDDLFIRNGNQMDMTDRASHLYPKLKAWLQELDEIIAPEDFDPLTSDQTFVIACSDLFEHMYGPVILKNIYVSAPSAKLKFVKLDSNNLIADLSNLKCDIAIAARSIEEKSIEQKVLYTDKYASCVNFSHPILRLEKSVDNYLSYPHILSSLNDGNTSIVDRSLEKINRKRNLKYVTFNFSNVPYFIEDSDVIWTAPSRYIKFCQRHHDIKQFTTPLRLSEIKISMFWSKTNEKSLSNIWFRRLISKITKHSYVNV